ncbi:MAG: serine hydrolase [Pseudomonadota bacterium]
MRTFDGLALGGRRSLFIRLFAIIVIATATIAAEFETTSAQARKYSGIVIDANSGKVLYSSSPDSLRYPASLTKMMTLYLVFEDLKAGRISKKTRIRFSKTASREQPSKLGIRAGRTITVEQAIYALVTKSANDVATAVAEHLGGSKAKFAVRMTRKARQLGMKRTVFKNPHGLPNRNQKTTARDMAKLGLALREHFPREFRYFKTRSFKYGKRRYGNHNRLLGRIKGVDGIKTGYTRASGFNLVSSVSSGKRRIVAVVIGGRTGRSRNAQMTKLIKRYLPKATRRKGGPLIARARSSATTQVASLKLPKSGPKPTFRSAPNKRQKPQIAVTTPKSRVELAHAASNATLGAHNERKIKQRLLALAAESMPLPVRRPIPTDPVVTASVMPKPKSLATIRKQQQARKKVARPSGWHIQIGAAESTKKAEELLDRAQKRGKRVLSKRRTYTEEVRKGRTLLVRARFVGFPSKSSARKACSYLRKRKFACLAINDG